MHGTLEGHSSPLKFWGSLSNKFSQLSPFLNYPKISRSPLKFGGWHHKIYVFHTIDNIHWFYHTDSSDKLTLTMVIHFLSCDLYERK